MKSLIPNKKKLLFSIMSTSFLVLSAVNADTIDTSDAQDRIVGGTEAKPGEFPFMVGLADKIGQFCGGSLVSPTRVLTAAHCVPDGNPNGLSVRANGL